MKRKILEILDEERDAIARAHAARSRKEIPSMRAVSAPQMEAVTRMMIALFVQHLRAGDSPMPMEIEVLSRERARLGIPPGDMAEGWIRCLQLGRDAVMARIPDGELRAALAAWAEVDRIAAVMIGWLVEQHRKNVETPR